MIVKQFSHQICNVNVFNIFKSTFFTGVNNIYSCFWKKLQICQHVKSVNNMFIPKKEKKLSGVKNIFKPKKEKHFFSQVSIPVVFLFTADAKLLLAALEADPQLRVTLQDSVGKMIIFFTSNVFGTTSTCV